MRFITLQGVGGTVIKIQPYDIKSIVGPLNHPETDAVYTEVRDGYGGQCFRVCETPTEIEKMIDAGGRGCQRERGSAAAPSG